MYLAKVDLTNSSAEVIHVRAIVFSDRLVMSYICMYMKKNIKKMLPSTNMCVVGVLLYYYVPI